MPGYRPPMYGGRRGRKLPAATPPPPATPAPVAETAEETRSKVEKARVKEAKKAAKAAPKAAPKPAAKKAAKTAPKAKKVAKAEKPAAKSKGAKLKKWRTTDTKDDLYWLAQMLKIDAIKTRTPKDEMIKILRRHPGAEEIKG